VSTSGLVWTHRLRAKLFIASADFALHSSDGDSVHPTKRTARIAGVVYLFSAAAAGVPLIYIPSALIIHDDAAATADRILASETLYRACMVSELTGAILFILLAWMLYQILKDIIRTRASLMVTLVLISLPITFLNVLNEIAALTLLHGASFLIVFDDAQRNALVLMFLGLHCDGANLANIF